ncbi:MAG: UDP-3-O-[3-hydroxymyristoyl] N-acetylglucosamine deacetylase [Methylophilaceae bacterium]|jgi:UDP-3-O-[3-hydroxymyristoyl] N-acetylglucosamine deacetylase
MIFQRSIKNKVSAVGVGLHSGQKVRIVLKPAKENSGVIFKRTDIKVPIEIKVEPQAVKETRLSSTISKGKYKISTVEHLMSALSASGIDNILIEVDGSEIPIMDGSSISFVYLIKSAVICEQLELKKFAVIKDVIKVEDGEKFAKFEPYNGFLVDFTIDFPHPAFKEKNNRVEIDFFKDSYVSHISRARTFGFMQEVEYLRSNGLARGGSLDNAIVLDEYKILNDEGLRYSDEFVRHKILDAIGDLYMIGMPIIGKFVAYKSGHELNNKLLRLMLKQKKKWAVEYLDLENEKTATLASDYAKNKNDFDIKNLEILQ